MLEHRAYSRPRLPDGSLALGGKPGNRQGGFRWLSRYGFPACGESGVSGLREELLRRRVLRRRWSAAPSPVSRRSKPCFVFRLGWQSRQVRYQCRHWPGTHRFVGSVGAQDDLRTRLLARLDAQVVEQEIAADAGVRDRLDAVEGIVGLDEGEHRVRQKRHRRYALEAIEPVMRPALAGEARLPRHVKRGAVLLEAVVARQVKQHGNDLAFRVGVRPQRIVGAVVDEQRLIAELALLAPEPRCDA